MINYVVRVERFGATIYQPDNLSYFFVNPHQINTLNQLYALNLDLKWQDGNLESNNKDWSQGKFTEMLSGSSISVKQPHSDFPLHTIAAPIRIYFEATTLCNAQCGYCLNNSGLARPNTLNTEEILKTIQQLGNDGVFEVRLTGGEVSILNDFEQISREVRDCGMTLTINSNLMGKPSDIDNIEKINPNLLITSLDANESSHKSGRGKGYRQVVNNVLRLREANISVRLNCALQTSTLDHVESFIDEFAPLGCDFCFILLRPVGRASTKFSPPSISKLMRCVDVINAKRETYPNNYFSTSFHVVMEKELVVGGINLTGCNAIQKSFNINSDGSVLPCAFLYELSKKKFSLGNIRDNGYSILPIWRNSGLLQELRKQSASCNTRCIGCNHFKKDCLGSCVFMDLYSKHTGKPDPYCQISMNELNTTSINSTEIMFTQS